MENELVQLEQNSAKGLSTLELTKKAFLTAFSAEKDFLAADDQQKYDLLKILLWNLTIKDQKVQSYQLMSEAAKNLDFVHWQGQ